MPKCKYIYAFRSPRHLDSARHQILVEFDGKREWAAAKDDPRYIYDATDARQAHAWVKDDLPHETALYLEDGHIRRAKEEE